MKVAKAKGRLRGKQPKLKPTQEAHLVELWRGGKHTSAELAELFSVAGPFRECGDRPRYRGSCRSALARMASCTYWAMPGATVS